MTPAACSARYSGARARTGRGRSRGRSTVGEQRVRLAAGTTYPATTSGFASSSGISWRVMRTATHDAQVLAPARDPGVANRFRGEHE